MNPLEVSMPEPNGLSAELQRLLRHMEWADALVWSRVLAKDAQRDDRLFACLHHMHAVHWVYLQLWLGEPVDVPEASTFGDARALYGWAREYYERASGRIDCDDANLLQRTVAFPWAAQLIEQWGVARTATFAQTVMQVATHTCYHRGQANARLRQLGIEPPLTDFIAWIWAGQPPPDWPA